MRRKKIEPPTLKLEITETTMMFNKEEVIKVFENLKEIGIKFALDDFGTGYSSFGYLKTLPFNVIKIDRTLVMDIVEDEKTRIIAGAIISIIHELGLEVIVEGVETLEQLEILKQLDCDSVQGYIFSKPLTSQEFINYFFTYREGFVETMNCVEAACKLGFKLNWRKEWECGEPIIDEQHRYMLQKAYEMYDRIGKNEDDFREEELVVLIEEITGHFAYEENLLQKINYKHYEAHLEWHNKLTEKLLRLKDRFNSGQLKITGFLSYILNDVVLRHLLVEDVRFFPLLNRKK